MDVTLNTDAGLIHVTDYYVETPGVGAPGRVQFRKIKHGSAGGPIKQAAFEYATHTAAGVTVHPLAKRAVPFLVSVGRLPRSRSVRLPAAPVPVAPVLHCSA